MEAALDFDGYIVLDRQEAEHDIRFTVRYAPETLACIHCGSLERPSKHGILTQVVMDMPIRAKRVGLAIRIQRYKCKDCKKTYMQNIAFIDEKRAATQRLIRVVEEQSLKRTFTSRPGLGV